MLKGHVFSRQLFESHMFALFVNTFLNGANGVSNNYKNGMEITYSGSTVTVNSGAAVVQGRFVEEESYTTISAGTDNAYCKLVIEIDLDKQNTESDFRQGAYKIIKGTNAYPILTQNNIVKDNSGIYQYELARFRTSLNGISDFQDMRTFLDFDSIYDKIEQHIQDIDDGSAFVNKGDVAVITGTLTISASNSNTATLSYPTGFNKNNSVLISNGIVANNDANTKGFNYYGIYSDSTDGLNNAYRRRVNFTNDGIKLYIQNPNTEELVLQYKLVLMKIS